VMWILLVIILSSPPTVDIVDSKVLGLYHSLKECEDSKQNALDLAPPSNVNVGCIPLKGVRQANG